MKTIPVAKPYLGKEEAEAASEAILSGWVTQGPRVQAFEEAFARTVSATHACAVSNCTAALHLALLGVGVRPGDVVLTVSHSFIATANAIRHCGAEPVFVDIDPETFNLNPENLVHCLAHDCEKRGSNWYFKDVERIAVGESPLRPLVEQAQGDCASLGRVAALLPVHQMGRPCDITRIVEIGQQNAIPVVEDAACAIGSEISPDKGDTWEMIGRPHGDAACFSFHPRKVLTTGDGGMITTNNGDLAERFRLLRQHGMSLPDTVRHAAQKVAFEEYLTTGFNYRLTDIQAAMGIEQLKRLPKLIAERRNLARAYSDALAGISWLQAPVETDEIRGNWQSYPVRLLADGPWELRPLMQHLLDRGISTRRSIMNAHQEPPYSQGQWELPASEEGRDQTILLPFYNGMTMEDMQLVTTTLKEATP